MNYFNPILSRPFATPQTAQDDMTILTSTPPSSLPPSSQIPGLNLLSAAQFDAEVAARKAAASSPSHSPANKRPKLDSPTSSSSSAPRIPLPSKPRGDHAAKLNDLCQLRRLRADYDFEEGPPFAFSVCLRLLDGDQAVQEFEAPGTYGSKKAAKEKAAEMGLNWLEAQAGPEKQKKGQAQGLLPAVAEKPDMSENWVGVLHEFCQSTHREQPNYPICDLGQQRFGATCNLFGAIHHDPTAAFANKKFAKTAAARAAVLALRESGVLPKPLPSRSANTTPIASTVPVLATSPVPMIPASPAAETTTSLSPQPSPSAQVPALCNILAITPPTYKLVQSSPQTPDFFDAAAYFENAVEPCLRGAVGRVERVYGKKKAREQVARAVLVVLERIKVERLAG